MSHPLAGASVGFIKIPVRDFGAAVTFYRDVLGLSEDFAVEEFGWGQFATTSVPICLYAVGKGGGDGQPGGDTGIQLRVTDAAAAFAHLNNHAVGDLQTGDDGTSTFVVADPDGNRIQIAQLPQ